MSLLNISILFMVLGVLCWFFPELISGWEFLSKNDKGRKSLRIVVSLGLVTVGLFMFVLDYLT
jgi:hypothetical protein